MKTKKTASGIRVYCSHDKIVPIDELVPNPRNPNQHPDEQIELLAKIIQSNGWRNAITVSNLSGMIVKGHGRYQAAARAGLSDVPVDYQDYESRDDEIKDLIADNKISELSVIDTKEARALIESLDSYQVETDFDLSDFGFTNDEILEYFPGESQGQTADDEVPEVDEAEVKTKTGDLYLLGNHRLLCGDATKAEDVERLMDGKKADMVLTDPPYGMQLNPDYRYRGRDKNNFGERELKQYDKIIGDDCLFDAGFILPMAKEIFLWGADYYKDSIPQSGSWIVWDKTGGNDSLLNAGLGSNFELCWSKQRHKRDIARITYKGVAGMKKEDGKRVHPNQKPVGLAEWFIKKWGNNIEFILDLFLGSGATLIACEKTNRICYGMEIDPHYCDVIVKRWEDYTGETAKLT